MILRELFGETSRIKILGELLAYSEQYLTAEEIARMADVSSKTVYIHLTQLSQIGIVEVKKESFQKFKLNLNDERVLALLLIETNEYLRQSKRDYLKFKTVELDESAPAGLDFFKPSNEVALQFTVSK